MPQSGIMRTDFAIDTLSLGRYNVSTNFALTESRIDTHTRRSDDAKIGYGSLQLPQFFIR